MRQHLIIILAGLLVMSAAGTASAASSSAAEVKSITIVPESPAQGQVPAITGAVARSKSPMSLEPASFNIIIVITLPNNTTKSSMWKSELFERGQSKEYPVPRLFDTKLAGQYKVQFHVYSSDMRSRLATAAKTFTVGQAVPIPATAAKKEEPKQPAAERHIFGLGLYGNAFNPAGGGTTLLWPFEHVGLQGIYTVGQFTTIEGRLLVKFGKVAGTYPYLGAGYISVAKDSTVIGVSTTFRDSSVSGAVGAEVPLGRRLFGYVEVSGSPIRLRETVTNGAQAVNAKISYSSVTIGAGIVLYLF